MLETISACRLLNCSIFIKGTDLFDYNEYMGSDCKADMKHRTADPVMQKWWQNTKPCFAQHAEQI